MMLAMKRLHLIAWVLCSVMLTLSSPATANDSPPDAKEGGVSDAKREAAGRRAYPPKMEGAVAEVYKTVENIPLNLYLFKPADWKASDKRPAIVFFFGGGWTSGSPASFERHCRHFAKRGMIAITADYRVKSRHGVTPIECVADAKSAIRWTRANAARLGIDPERIAAAGGSAGGHIAACAAIIEGFDEKSEDPKVSSKPNALVLFNPALGGDLLEKRLGDRAAAITPTQHVRPNLPPTIIFHGKADATVPYATVEAFTEAMTKAGNRCELVGFEGQPHAFYNKPGNYEKTVERADEFLVSLEYLKSSGSDVNKRARR